MNSFVLLKLFEYCLSPNISGNLHLNDLQMGFRNHSGCINTVMILKEIIGNYDREGSNVHCAMLDLSKAFDRLNPNILIQKLRSTNISNMIVDTLEFMLKNSNVHVSFNNTVGNSWRSVLGTRQGGILSPLLFNFYLKECVERVTNQNEGCNLGPFKCNILTYADDIILVAPSANGLQNIVNSFGDSILNTG